ncbi:MAG: DUF6194 family protein [Lachnospiraceae bacterium]
MDRRRYDDDSSSDLNRENLYRVNLGVRKHTFEKLFSLIFRRHINMQKKNTRRREYIKILL